MNYIRNALFFCMFYCQLGWAVAENRFTELLFSGVEIIPAYSQSGAIQSLMDFDSGTPNAAPEFEEQSPTTVRLTIDRQSVSFLIEFTGRLWATDKGKLGEETTYIRFWNRTHGSNIWRGKSRTPAPKIGVDTWQNLMLELFSKSKPDLRSVENLVSGLNTAASYDPQLFQDAVNVQMPFSSYHFAMTDEGGRYLSRAVMGECGMAALCLPIERDSQHQKFNFSGVILVNGKAIACRRGTLTMRDFSSVPEVFEQMEANAVPLPAHRSDARSSQLKEKSYWAKHESTSAFFSVGALVLTLLFTSFRPRKGESHEFP